MSDPISTVVTYEMRHNGAAPRHDRRSRASVARRLADVMGWRYGGEYGNNGEDHAQLYFVPQDALTLTAAKALGIRSPHHLFGGVVPHEFIATKAITHPLVAHDARAPAGWSGTFADWAGDSVLRGYTTFSAADARRAAQALLREGPVRMKCVTGIGGAGQHLVRSEGEIEAVLAAIADREFDAGVAVEEHLEDSVTFCAGRVECGGETIAYCGTQSTTRNGRGHEVYGGSQLDIVRGGFGALAASGLAPERAAAVELAQAYDNAAFAAYPGAFASRRNYDVLFGRDAKGRGRAGVLEQSWRIGGASAAEVLAFAALRRDPARARVRCATVEIYDDQCPIPAGAFVCYRGVDAQVGPLTKYAIELDDRDA